MNTKLPASVIVLGVISIEGNVMRFHFIDGGARINVNGYIRALETVVVAWMNDGVAGRYYTFQQY